VISLLRLRTRLRLRTWLLTVFIVHLIVFLSNSLWSFDLFLCTVFLLAIRLPVVNKLELSLRRTAPGGSQEGMAKLGVITARIGVVRVYWASQDLGAAKLQSALQAEVVIHCRWLYTAGGYSQNPLHQFPCNKCTT